MKEWFLENTNITEQEYENALKFKEAQEIADASKNNLGRIMLIIESFTLNPKFNKFLSTFLVRRLKNGSFSYKGIPFRFFHDIYEDPTLFTPDRYGKCVQMSWDLARMSNFDVVTANCIDFKNEDGEEFVYDYTRNLIMEKKFYYKLLSVQEIKVIPSDKFQRYANELEVLVREKHLDFTLFEFFCFPDEAIEAARSSRSFK